MEILVLIIVAVGIWVWWSAHNTKKRRDALLKKYGNPELVDRLMRRMFWQGQTQEQLLDSLGRPLDIDERVFKTKTKETWKYNQLGKNRYGLRVILEDGVVVGWDQK